MTPDDPAATLNEQARQVARIAIASERLSAELRKSARKRLVVETHPLFGPVVRVAPTAATEPI